MAALPPRLKILHVGSSMPDDWGGIERYVKYLSDAQASQGHEVTVSAVPGSPLSDRLAVPQVPIRLRGKHDLAAYAAYRRLFRGQRFDVVSTHFSPDYLMPALAARGTGQRLLVLTRHVAVPWSRNKARSHACRYDRFLAVSEAVRRSLVESGVPPMATRVALSGCPALTASPPAENGGFRVGYFGRLVPEKGVDTLLAAAQGGFETHVYGDGPESGRLRAQWPAARFHGFVPDVAAAMASVDVVAVPSQWEEALGFAAMEAMSLGKAVLASRVGGLPELIEHGETGLLLPAGEVVAWRAALRRLADDPAEVARLGTNAARAHRDRFTPAHMAARVERAYRDS